MKCAADKEDVLMLVFHASINPLVGANHDVGITTSKCKAVLPAYAAWCQLCIQRSKMFTPVQTHRGEDYAWLSEVHKWFSLELQHLEHVVLKGQIIKKNVQHYILEELVGALSPDIRHNIRAEKKHILLHFCLWLIQVTQTCGRPFTYGKWQQLRWNCTGIQMYSSDDDWKLLWISITAAISWNGEWSCLHPLYEYSLGSPCTFFQHSSSFVLTALDSWNQ